MNNAQSVFGAGETRPQVRSNDVYPLGNSPNYQGLSPEVADRRGMMDIARFEAQQTARGAKASEKAAEAAQQAAEASQRSASAAEESMRATRDAVWVSTGVLIVALAALVIGVVQNHSRTRELGNASAFAHAMCSECGLTTQEVELLIDANVGLDPTRSWELFQATFANQVDSRPCEPCSRAILAAAAHAK